MLPSDDSSPSCQINEIHIPTSPTIVFDNWPHSTSLPSFDEYWTCHSRNPKHYLQTSKDFNDAFYAFAAHLPGYPDHWYLRQVRDALPDTSQIVFTHGDLQSKNIMMSATGTDILAILDWTQSGWYPCYWEYIKAFCWTPSSEVEKSWQEAGKCFIQPGFEAELTAIALLHSMGVLV